MKQLFAILAFSLLMTCNNDSKNPPQNPEKEPTKTAPISVKKTSTKTANKGTYLCKINGKDWAYTKASGIVSTDRKTKKRTALITFKQKLEKGSESIQLHYDANSFELIKVSLQLKFKHKSGKLTTCYYDFNPQNKKRNPQTKMSGTIDLSNTSSASGTGEITNMNINYEKEKLADSKNSIVNMTGLNFSGVGYSDLDKLSKAFKK